jgi:hypothetical protein
MVITLDDTKLWVGKSIHAARECSVLRCRNGAFSRTMRTMKISHVTPDSRPPRIGEE